MRYPLILSTFLFAALAGCGGDLARELEKAEQLVQRQAYDQAFRRFAELCRSFPDEHTPHARLAWLAVRRGQPAEALATLEDYAQRHGGERPEALDLLGTLFERLDRLDEAETHYREALAARPGQPALALKLSRVLARRGRYDKALEVASQGVESSPRDVQLRSWLGEMLVKRRRWEDAESLLRDTLELPGAGAYPHYILGLVYFHTGRLDEARAELETSTDLQPRVDEVWYQLANVLDHLGDTEARDRALEKFTELYRPKVMP